MSSVFCVGGTTRNLRCGTATVPFWYTKAPSTDVDRAVGPSVKTTAGSKIQVSCVVIVRTTRRRQLSRCGCDHEAEKRDDSLHLQHKDPISQDENNLFTVMKHKTLDSAAMRIWRLKFYLDIRNPWMRVWRSINTSRKTLLQMISRMPLQFLLPIISMSVLILLPNRKLQNFHAKWENRISFVVCQHKKVTGWCLRQLSTLSTGKKQHLWMSIAIGTRQAEPWKKWIVAQGGHVGRGGFQLESFWGPISQEKESIQLNPFIKAWRTGSEK